MNANSNSNWSACRDVNTSAKLACTRPKTPTIASTTSGTLNIGSRGVVTRRPGCSPGDRQSQPPRQATLTLGECHEKKGEQKLSPERYRSGVCPKSTAAWTTVDLGGAERLSRPRLPGVSSTHRFAKR